MFFSIEKAYANKHNSLFPQSPIFFFLKKGGLKIMGETVTSVAESNGCVAVRSYKYNFELLLLSKFDHNVIHNSTCNMLFLVLSQSHNLGSYAFILS